MISRHEGRNPLPRVMGNVSRETLEAFATYANLLRRWQASHNLVGRETLDAIEDRHFADSAQLLQWAPGARCWLDIGSGAGFPGMVIALLLRDEPGTLVHLVESNRKKCSFLRQVARQTGARVQVWPARIEDVKQTTIGPVDVVTARAVAPLPQLLEMAEPFIAQGAIGLFLKGANAHAEVDEAATTWTFDLKQEKSIASDSTILFVSDLARRKAAG